MAQVTTNVRLLSVEQTDTGGLIFRFSDNPLTGVFFENMDVFNSLIQQLDQMIQLLEHLSAICILTLCKVTIKILIIQLILWKVTFIISL